MMGRRIRYVTTHYPTATQFFLIFGCFLLYVISVYGYVRVYTSDEHITKLLFFLIFFNLIFMVSTWGLFIASSNLGELLENKRRQREEHESGKTGEDKRR